MMDMVGASKACRWRVFMSVSVRVCALTEVAQYDVVVGLEAPHHDVLGLQVAGGTERKHREGARSDTDKRCKKSGKRKKERREREGGESNKENEAVLHMLGLSGKVSCLHAACSHFCPLSSSTCTAFSCIFSS